MGTDASPGQSATEFLGGKGEFIYAEQNSPLLDILPTLDIAAKSVNYYDGQKRDPLRPGMTINDIFDGQKVTVMAPKSGGLLSLFDNMLDIDRLEPLRPQAAAPEGPSTTLPKAKVDTPKNG